MSKYINLDDPDVTYSHNAGNHEVYIVGSEAERIDIARCRECKWHRQGECHNPRYGDGWANYPAPAVNDEFYCADGKRREDG